MNLFIYKSRQAKHVQNHFCFSQRLYFLLHFLPLSLPLSLSLSHTLSFTLFFLSLSLALPFLSSLSLSTNHQIDIHNVLTHFSTSIQLSLALVQAAPRSNAIVIGPRDRHSPRMVFFILSASLFQCFGSDNMDILFCI